MLPTVTTASEIGINLAQFGELRLAAIAGSWHPKRALSSLPPSLPGSPQVPENDPPVWARGRAATAPSPASRQISPSIISFIGFGLFGCGMPGIYFLLYTFYLWYMCIGKERE